MFLISKDKRLLITSGALALGFIAVNLLDNSYRFFAIGALAALTAILVAWVSWEGLGIDSTLITLILPFLYTLGVGLFWFLIPATIIARIPIILLFAGGIYVLSASENIFAVSAIRKIPLARGAHGAGFVLTLLVAFLLFDAILSVRLNILLTSLAIGLVSLPLFLQGFWMSDHKKQSLKSLVKSDILLLTMISTVGTIEMGLLLYFWPVTVVVGSIFLTVAVYTLLGLGQARIEGRLFKDTIRDYLIVAAVVLVVMYFFTHWGA